MTEGQAQVRLIKKLSEYGFFWKASDRFRAGIPDVIGVVAGQFIAIEMKIDYNTATPLQTHTLAVIRDNGGFAEVVTYKNRTKRWCVGDDVEYASPAEMALYLMGRADVL